MHTTDSISLLRAIVSLILLLLFKDTSLLLTVAWPSVWYPFFPLFPFIYLIRNIYALLAIKGSRMVSFVKVARLTGLGVVYVTCP